MIYPWSGLEIDWVERHATATPDRRSATKTALPVFVRRAVQRLIRHFADVQGLRVVRGSKATRFQQQNAAPGPGQFHRQRDTGWAAANNADVGPNDRIANDLVSVLDHRLPP